MPTNDFIGFASSGSANVASQADYAAAAEQGIGMQSGPASSKLANKAWRQGANMAAALGRIAVARGFDALDNGDIDALQNSIDDTISVGTFNRMYFSQTSGSYTAPRTGVYRITLKGGGGGGGGARTDNFCTGSGGGEGGMLIFYTTLIKSQSYPYVIGAGGAGGTSGDVSNATAGNDGGQTSFNSEYIIGGGYGGARLADGGIGGGGGYTFSVPTGVTAKLVSGQAGQSHVRGPSRWGASSANGGGATGMYRNNAQRRPGSGGLGHRAMSIQLVLR